MSVDDIIGIGQDKLHELVPTAKKLRKRLVAALQRLRDERERKGREL